MMAERRLVPSIITFGRVTFQVAPRLSGVSFAAAADDALRVDFERARRNASAEARIFTWAGDLPRCDFFESGSRRLDGLDPFVFSP